VLHRGDDADRVTGCAGEDEIEGGPGKDVIWTRDRHGDEVDGDGRRDTVVVDPADELTRCEIVWRR
jgi:hypothetical protein